MKILLASSSSGSRGGGELFLVYLGRALAQRGHQVTLWASTHSRMDELSNTFHGFGEVVRSPYANTYDRRARSLASYFNFGGARKLAREWKRLAPDIIHLNKQNLEDGLDLLRAAHKAHVPSLATIHLTQTARFLKAQIAPLRDWIAHRALAAFPGMLVAVQERRWKELLGFLGASPRVRFVPNGVPLFDLAPRESSRATRRAELGLTHGEVLFIGVGRMVPQKRPLLFLEQARLIHQQMPQARFVWMGEGALAPEWDAWVAAHGMAGTIRRMPWQHDMQPTFFAADVFMHTAEFEGLALALLEAMSAALPVALTPNLISELPFLAPMAPIALGKEIDFAALGNRTELRRRGEVAREIVRDQFSFERMAENYELLYKTLATSTAWQ